VRFDGAQEFGKSLSFKSFCHQEKIVMEPVAHYTHIQNARAENAIRVAKEHIRCLLRASNSLQATRCGMTLLPIFTSLGHTSPVIYLALTLL
jgi:hypothetical protein